MSSRIDFGKKGEDAAVGLLESRGYKILERNFKVKLGEIDIIALDGDTICFVEVKTRASEDFGGALGAISSHKQHKISQTALCYLKLKHMLERKARFDVASVTKDSFGALKVEILKDAFELSALYGY